MPSRRRSGRRRGDCRVRCAGSPRWPIITTITTTTTGGWAACARSRAASPVPQLLERRDVPAVLGRLARCLHDHRNAAGGGVAEQLGERRDSDPPLADVLVPVAVGGEAVLR